MAPKERSQAGSAETTPERSTGWHSIHAAELERRRLDRAEERARRRGRSTPPRVQRRFVATTLSDVLERLSRIEQLLWASYGFKAPRSVTPARPSGSDRLFESLLQALRDEADLKRKTAMNPANEHKSIMTRLEAIEVVLKLRELSGR